MQSPLTILPIEDTGFVSPKGEMGYTPEVKAKTAPIYDRVRSVIPEVEWSLHGRISLGSTS